MDFSNFLTRQVINLIICSLFLCALLYFIYKLYLLYTNRIVRVECWFCKASTSVHVGDKNSFFCSSCHQYNGFTESGDYNCNLPAQYDVHFNSQVFAIRSNARPNHPVTSDIFCTACTQRQAYEIAQLANFEPSNEANWDQELRQFKKELESHCRLCPSCILKAYKRINSIDMKLIPKVLLWWRNRNQNEPPSIESADQLQFAFLIPTISAIFRIVTTLIWLYISFPFALHLFDDNVCKSVSLSLLKSQCQRIGILKSGLLYNAVILRLLETVCLISHLGLLLLQILQPTSNPFFALLDAVLLVLSASFIITHSKTLSSVFSSILILVFVFAISAGVLVFRYLPYAQKDIRLQTKRLKATWPKPNSSHLPSSYLTASSAAVKLVDDASLSLDGLSLHNAPSHRSTIFSPSTLSTSSPLFSHVYAASASPSYPYLRAKNIDGFRVSRDFDSGSHFTSVSQLSKRSKKVQRKRSRQPTGLLRWTMYLLFGRLETWRDVKAELVCLLNAVLVGVLLVLICHFFYITMSALWTMKA